MILAVLVLILSVLLFGSSAVIGFFGAILGFIAFCAGLTMVFIAADGVSPQILWIIGGGIAAIIAMGGLALKIQHDRTLRDAKRKHGAGVGEGKKMPNGVYGPEGKYMSHGRKE